MESCGRCPPGSREEWDHTANTFKMCSVLCLFFSRGDVTVSARKRLIIFLHENVTVVLVSQSCVKKRFKNDSSHRDILYDLFIYLKKFARPRLPDRYYLITIIFSYYHTRIARLLLYQIATNFYFAILVSHKISQ